MKRYGMNKLEYYRGLKRTVVTYSGASIAVKDYYEGLIDTTVEVSFNPLGDNTFIRCKEKGYLKQYNEIGTRMYKSTFGKLLYKRNELVLELESENSYLLKEEAVTYGEREKYFKLMQNIVSILLRAKLLDFRCDVREDKIYLELHNGKEFCIRITDNGFSITVNNHSPVDMTYGAFEDYLTKLIGTFKDYNQCKEHTTTI